MAVKKLYNNLTHSYFVYMKKKFFLHIFLLLFLGYLSIYTFWQAFLGQKSILVVDKMNIEYSEKLKSLKEHKMRNAILNNRMNCLSADAQIGDLADQKAKEIGFFEENEVLVSNSDN